MGPIRRGLILTLLAIAPSQAFAQVCDTERPEWTGMPVSAFDEAVSLISTTPSLLLILFTLLSLRFKSVWGGLATVVGWTIWISVVNSSTVFPLRQAAAQEGCVGSNALFIAFAIAICVLIVLYTAPRSTVGKNGEN